LDSTGTYLWSANTADNSISAPMIAKFSLSTYTDVLQITGATKIPNTLGFLCSGGITVWGGYRAGTSSETPLVVYPSWLDSLVTRYPRRLRRTPHVSDTGQRLRHVMFQVDTQPGMYDPEDPTVERWFILRTSDDGGNTWSSERRVSPGEMGQYLTRPQWWLLPMARDLVYEVTTNLPNPLIQAWIIVIPMEH